jgi:hypothetical protein
MRVYVVTLFSKLFTSGILGVSFSNFLQGRYYHVHLDSACFPVPALSVCYLTKMEDHRDLL